MSAPRLVFSSRPALSSTVPAFLSGPEAEAMEQELAHKIGERARQLFEESGNAPGNDEANWLRAENEVLVSGLEIRESGTWTIMNASLPNVSGQDIQIVVKPARIVVRAREMESAANSSAASHPDVRELFLAANLPAEIDPASAAGSFRDHTLRLMFKKRQPNESTAAPDAASNTVSSGG